MDTTLKVAGIGAFYLLAIGLGIWLSHSGRPLNAALSAVHKLVSLAAAVVTAVVFAGMLKGNNISALPLIELIAAIICIVALIATGAIMSGAKARNKTFLLIHNIATVLAVTCLAGLAAFAL